MSALLRTGDQCHFQKSRDAFTRVSVTRRRSPSGALRSQRSCASSLPRSLPLTLRGRRSQAQSRRRRQPKGSCYRLETGLASAALRCCRGCCHRRQVATARRRWRRRRSPGTSRYAKNGCGAPFSPLRCMTSMQARISSSVMFRSNSSRSTDLNSASSLKPRRSASPVACRTVTRALKMVIRVLLGPGRAAMMLL